MLIPATFSWPESDSSKDTCEPPMTCMVKRAFDLAMVAFSKDSRPASRM